LKRASHSSYKDWNSCPALWYGRRKGDWKVDSVQSTSALDKGTYIHSILSEYHVTGNLPVIDTELVDDNVVEQINHYVGMVPVAPGDKSEQYFKVTHRDIPIPVIGYFDLLRSNGWIYEYKTTQYPYIWNSKRVSEEKQATLYWWAYWTIYKKPPAGIRYWIIPTDGKSTIRRYDTTRTLEQIKENIKDIAEFVREEKIAQDNEALYIPKCIVTSKEDKCVFPEECWKLLTKNGSYLLLENGEISQDTK
jgi:hypothetical protein